MAKARGTGAKKVAARAGKAPVKPARKPARSQTASAKSAKSRIVPAKPQGAATKPRAAAAKPATATPRRQSQRFVVSHLREDDFATNGLRAYAQYRDLGIAAASHGLVQAHVIRLIGPCNPSEVSKLHYHDVEFQLVYVLKGWVKAEFEGKGEILMRTGSCWTQPPRIKHMILDYSNDCELLEVILPAEFETTELA
jgi:mannose-6-phosphate isomerase-like protein (cupin superfamily)